MKTIIHNGHIITPDQIIENGSIIIENGIIVDVVSHQYEEPNSIYIDAMDLYVSPGFIDLHVHGGGGHDFMDCSIEAFQQIARTHLQHGTTAMMPTTLSSTNDALEKVLTTYQRNLALDESGIQWLGMHVEGPYFALNQRGAQDPRFIRNPNKDEYNHILENFNCITRWSIAPELEGALEMGRLLSQRGIIPSIAHTDAVYEDVINAFKNGYSLVTHLYSAMNGVIRKNAYRYAGVVEAAFLINELDVEIIADGKHLPVPLLQLIYKNKGADRIALITDAIRPAGTNVQTSLLGSKEFGIEVLVEDEVAKLPDRSSFAGSVATFDRLIRIMWKETGIALTEVIKMASTTPARIAKFQNNMGSLEKGKDANIVFFDKDVDIKKTIIKGQIKYEKTNKNY